MTTLKSATLKPFHGTNSGSECNTRLGHDDPLLLPSAETKARDVIIPGRVDWSALGDPENGEDAIRDRQEDDCALKRSNESFCDWNAQQEETNGDFGPHQGRKSLNPFTISVFSKFNDLPFLKVILRSSKAVVDLNEVQARADYIAQLQRICG